MNHIHRSLLSLTVILFGILYGVKSDIFTASGSMAKLAKAEYSMRSSLRKDYKKVDGKNGTIDRIVKEILTHNFSTEQDVLDYIGHPFNCYRLIKNWYILNVNQDGFARLKAALGILRVDLPDMEDRRGAAAAIIRLTHTYNLSVPEMVEGRIHGVQGSPPSASDCLDIGNAAYNLEDYALALQWYDGALQAETDEFFNKVANLMKIAAIHFQAEDYSKALEYAKEALKIDGSNKEVINKVRVYRIQSEIGKKKGHVVKTPASQLPRKNMDDLKYLYEALCRGDHIEPVRTVKKKLVCKFKKTSVPYARTREEILSYDPRMGIIHRIISDNEADYIKNISINKLERCRVGDPAKPVESDIRISKLVWFFDSQDKFIERLSKRVSQITGLDTTERKLFASAEAFQMVNYGIGGHYEVHVDFYEDKKALKGVLQSLQGTGDRIMTFLFYLGDIRSGGKTAFPRVKLAVPAVRNAASYWYNIKRDGELDLRTLHAGCPVLLGEKWIMNKWIREYGQEFKRPCGRTPAALDPLT